MAKSKYETHVKPYLKEIKEWIKSLNEEEIATKKLGVSVRSFTDYKKNNPELRQALIERKQNLAFELKETLRKKAKGYYYEETKITKIHNPDNEAEPEWIEKIEVNRKYAQPDTGAAHLLLKNIDPNWRNDDAPTMELKKKQIELQKQKLEQDNW